MSLVLVSSSATQITHPSQMQSRKLAVHLSKLSPRAKELSEFLKTLPTVQHAFAYGSGIFQQEGLYSAGSKGPMLDFILAVDNPEEWHDQVKLTFNSACTQIDGSKTAKYQRSPICAELLGKQAALFLACPLWRQIGKYSLKAAAYSSKQELLALNQAWKNNKRDTFSTLCASRIHLLQVTCNAERLGAGVHFNTAVPWEKTVMVSLYTRCRVWPHRLLNSESNRAILHSSHHTLSKL